FERGVVFYLRDERVVGVLLWNLFNRMHVARQVLARGHFDDLFEVAKLFSPQEEE
ncbi:jg993, partial [Pararge aegeria aegeria]